MITSVGARIKSARAMAGLSQGELARRVGTKQTRISEYENGKFCPSEERLRAIADACEMDWDEFVSMSVRYYEQQDQMEREAQPAAEASESAYQKMLEGARALLEGAGYKVMPGDQWEKIRGILQEVLADDDDVPRRPGRRSTGDGARRRQADFGGPEDGPSKGAHEQRTLTQIQTGTPEALAQVGFDLPMDVLCQVSEPLDPGQVVRGSNFEPAYIHHIEALTALQCGPRF